jgi:hypothetical protein
MVPFSEKNSVFNLEAVRGYEEVSHSNVYVSRIVSFGLWSLSFNGDVEVEGSISVKTACVGLASSRSFLW